MGAAPRYHVATVEGYVSLREGSHLKRPGLSAHVIDALDAHRVVATFRSESPLQRKGLLDRPGRGKRLGKDGALAAAEALADEWNADDARL